MSIVLLVSHTDEILCTVTILTPNRRVTVVGLTLKGSQMSHSPSSAKPPPQTLDPC